MVMRTDRRTERAVEGGGQLTVTRAPRRPGVARPPTHPGPYPTRPGPSAPRSAPLPALPPAVDRPVRRPHRQSFGADPHYAPAPRAVARPTSAQVARRRRAVALVLVAPVTFAVVVLLGQLAHVAQVAAVPDRTVAVQVGQGESLWQLARRAAPHADPGAVVERIVEVNGLESAAVSPGQVVLVPTS